MKELSRLALEEIVKAIPAGVVVIDKEGLVIYVNKRANELLGTDPSGRYLSEYVGKTFKLLDFSGNPYSIEELPASIALIKGVESKTEMVIQRPDGLCIVISTSAMPILNENGEITASVSIFEDITERKKSEEALKESEQLYKTLFNNSTDGFQVDEVLFDDTGNPVDWRILEVNQAFEKQTGFKQTDVVGKRVKEIVHEVEFYWVAAYGRVAKTGKSEHIENYNRGTKRWFDAYIFRYKDDKVATLFRDITKRKQAEEELKLSQERFEQMIEQSPVVFEVYDLQGFQTKVNVAYEKFWSIPKELTLGKYNIRTSEQVIKSNLLQYVNQAYAGEIVKVPDYEYDASLEPSTNGRGRKRWLNAILYPLKDKNGEVTGIVVLHEDVTDRKEAEKALKDSERKFFALFDQTPLTFGIYDKNGYLVQVNPAWDKLWQVPRDYVLGIWNILHSKQVMKIGWIPLLERAYSGETAFIKESLFDLSLEPESCGEGRKRWLRSTIFPIKDAKGDVASIVMTHEDITDMKMLENELKDKERFATIGQTAGMVGHDIRNPLQAMISDIYLMKDEVTSDCVCKNKSGLIESLDGIDENISYINKIVQDLQDYARPLNPEYSVTAISDVFVKVFENVRVPDSIKLSIKVKDLEKTSTDPMLLQRALSNLVTNAIQAMPNGGTLEVSAHPEGNKAVITVSDTGVGIPDDVKPKLFAPMVTTKSKGQGFGLAVSKRIIEAMDGSISFESERGKGTKFTIELPIS